MLSERTLNKYRLRIAARNWLTLKQTLGLRNHIYDTAEPGEYSHIVNHADKLMTEESDWGVCFQCAWLYSLAQKEKGGYV